MIKLLFTAVVIGVVWFGFKYVGRLAERKADESLDKKAKSPKKADVEDMVKCAKCGTYVPSSGAKSCGRDNCPYPG